MTTLFQRSFYQPEQSFQNLFRLLDDFDTYSRETGAQKNLTKNGTRVGRLFSPRFDVRETEHSYELHGELPGVDRNNISLEFTEPQTLVVSGRVDRKYSSSTPEQTTEDSDTVVVDRSASPSGHKATVTDEATEEAREKGEVAVQDKKDTAVQAANNQPAVRYWYQERSVGHFHRTFNFPSPVDEASVKANLENGILSVTIPKAVKHEARRIAVN